MISFDDWIKKRINYFSCIEGKGVWQKFSVLNKMPSYLFLYDKSLLLRCYKHFFPDSKYFINRLCLKCIKVLSRRWVIIVNSKHITLYITGFFALQRFHILFLKRNHITIRKVVMCFQLVFKHWFIFHILLTLNFLICIINSLR
jgi:hypothetical protein